MRDYAEISHNLRCCGVGVPCDDCTYQNDIAKCASLEGQAADAIEELLAAVPKWISVEERLPEEWHEVLAYMPIHSDEKNPHMIRICWYIGFGKWRETEYGEIVDIPVTHWMPLPEAPKEVE